MFNYGLQGRPPQVLGILIIDGKYGYGYKLPLTTEAESRAGFRGGFHEMSFREVMEGDGACLPRFCKIILVRPFNLNLRIYS